MDEPDTSKPAAVRLAIHDTYSGLSHLRLDDAMAALGYVAGLVLAQANDRDLRAHLTAILARGVECGRSA